MNYDQNSIEVCSLQSNWQYSNIGLDNGLAPTRRQAIIWTNDGRSYQRIYASLGLNELMRACTMWLIWLTYWSFHNMANIMQLIY